MALCFNRILLHKPTQGFAHFDVENPPKHFTIFFLAWVFVLKPVRLHPWILWTLIFHYCLKWGLDFNWNILLQFSTGFKDVVCKNNKTSPQSENVCSLQQIILQDWLFLAPSTFQTTLISFPASAETKNVPTALCCDQNILKWSLFFVGVFLLFFLLGWWTVLVFGHKLYFAFWQKSRFCTHLTGLYSATAFRRAQTGFPTAVLLDFLS